MSRGVNISHMVNFQLERPTSTTVGGSNSVTNTSRNNLTRNFRGTTRGNSSGHRPSTTTSTSSTASHCYLHTSSIHRFLVRQDAMVKLRNMAQKDLNYYPLSSVASHQQLTFLPSWEVIDAVTVLVDARQQQLHHQQRCPICLEDPYLVPRIFPCGHIFCFVCILQYAQHSLYNHPSTSTMSNPKTTSTTTSIPCPCCSKHVSIPQELRSVQFQSISSPALGCSMVFRKMCRYKTNLETTTTPTTTALVAIQDQRYAVPPNQTDPNSIYFRTIVQDTQLALQQLTWDAQTLQSMQQPTATLSTANGLNHYLHMAQQLIQIDIHNLLQQQQQQQQQEQKHPKQEDNYSPQDSLPSNLEIVGQTSCSNNNINTNVQQSFYQAIDGQLCFLCGFTMRCLLHEYNSSHYALPNMIEGRILGIETIQLDATVRKRYSFLQHYPNLMEVQLVELQLSPGILSKSTKQHFSKEFMKRKHARQRQQKEIDKQQQQQKGKQHQQTPYSSSFGFFYDEPSSEFTSLSTSTVASPLSEDFGPSLVPTLATASGTNDTSSTTLQSDPQIINSDPYTTFKAVLTTGGVWPELTTTAIATTATTATTTTTTSSTTTTMAAKLQNKIRVSAYPSTSTNNDIPSSSVATPKDDTKDKTRKKKVVLFSTGGHRGVR